MSTSTDSNLTKHARRELALMGLRDGDEMNKYMADAIEQMVETFAAQGHSGFSASYALDLLWRLLRFEPLTPLTDDPAEWNHIAEEMAGEPSLWQSQRNPAAFSHDGGKTYYLLSERGVNPSDRPLHASVPAT